MTKPVRDYGGKSVLGGRFEDEGMAEMKGGGAYSVGFPTERLVEP